MDNGGLLYCYSFGECSYILTGICMYADDEMASWQLLSCLYFVVKLSSYVQT